MICSPRTFQRPDRQTTNPSELAILSSLRAPMRSSGDASLSRRGPVAHVATRLTGKHITQSATFTRPDGSLGAERIERWLRWGIFRPIG